MKIELNKFLSVRFAHQRLRLMSSPPTEAVLWVSVELKYLSRIICLMLLVLGIAFSAEGVIDRLDSQDASDITDNDELYHAGQLIKIIATDSAQRRGLASTILIISQSTGYVSGLQNMIDENNGSYTFLWNTKNLQEADDYVVEVGLGFDEEHRFFTIKLDNTPPTDPRIVINNGAQFTANPLVDLFLSAQDATEIYISGDVVDDANTFNWLPYTEFIRVRLNLGYEEKSVQVQFRDYAKNLSETATATIIFERALISSQDADDPTDDDEIYHAGQLIQLMVTEAQGSTELDGTIQIKSQLAAYDSELQKLNNVGGGTYTYLWKTTGLEEAPDYIVNATFTSITGIIIDTRPLIITIDNDPPTDVDILINSDAPVTPLRSVFLTLSAAGAAEMFISGDVVDDTNTFEWVLYSTSLLVNLTERDGEKEVQVRFRDAAKNESDIATDTIKLDRTAPSAIRILIEGGKTYTDARTVILTLEAKNSTEMFISGDVVNDATTFEWIPYSSTQKVTLQVGDGEKTVSAKFRNALKLESNSVEASIILDTTPPAISSIQSQDAGNPADHDNHYHSNQKINIIIETAEMFASLTDAKGLRESGLIGDIQIKSDSRNYHSGSQKLQDKGDGTYNYLWDTTDLLEAQDYQIAVKLSDILDREVTDTSLVIILDNTPPQNGQVMINSGQVITASGSVSLTLSADEAQEMYLEGDIVADSNTFQWIPYPSEFGIVFGSLTNDFVLWVNLTDGDGEKEVLAKFRDAALNESLPVKATITLDRSSPKEMSITIANGEAYTVSRTVELTLSAQNAEQMLISGDVIYDSKTFTWIPYATKRTVTLTPGDGEKRVKVKFKNSAELESEFVEDTIILDMTAPVISSLQSQDVNNPRDADNYYHAGQRIKILVETEKKETGLTSTIQIFSATQGYKLSWALDSGSKTLQDEGNGSYSFLWDTEGLPEASDFRVEVKLSDAANHEVVDNSLMITIDNTPPQKGQLVINDGKQITGSRSVRLSISAEGAMTVYLEGDIVKDSNTFQWIPFPLNKGGQGVVLPSEFGMVVNLTDQDGEKEILVKFRDDALNESLPAKAIISLDKQAPHNLSVVIEGGEKYTASRTVTLTIDAQNATEIYIEGDVLPDANTYGWIKYVLKTEVTLTKGDGEKRVRVKFRNAEMIESEYAEAKIILDSTPPVVQKVQSRDTNNPQDADNYYHSGQQLEIRAEAKDAEAGLAGTIQIKSQSASYDSGTQPLKDEGNGFYSYLWTTDGLPEALDYLVEVKLKDSLGREALPSLEGPGVGSSLTISLDNTPPPKGTLVINDGQSSTDSRSVRLTVSVGASEIPSTEEVEPALPAAQGTAQAGATEIYIEGDVVKDGNTFRWILFPLNKGGQGVVIVPTLAVSLTDEDGQKEVLVKFRDAALNESEPQAASITLDRASPKALQLSIEEGKSYTASTVVTLMIAAKNAVEMYLEGDIVDTPETFEWIAFASQKQVTLTGGDGEKRVIARVRNFARIESEPVEASIILDSEPPAISRIESQDATNPGDNDNYYHAGQSIILRLITEGQESGLSGNLQIKSEKVNYNSGLQKLTDEGNGSYSYFWNTNWLQEARDYIVEAKLVDVLEREVTISPMTLIIDNTPPIGRITVNDNALRTIVRSVTLKADSSDAVEMYISGDVVDDTNTFEWIPYVADEMVLNLTDGTGKKVVKVKFRDGANNESEDVGTTIIFSTTPPKIIRVDSWDERDTSDNDEYYHAGQNIKIVIWGDEDEAWLLGTVRITSSANYYDSGAQKMIDEGNGRYTYLWDTEFSANSATLAQGEYSVEVVLSDGLSNEVSDNSLSITIDNEPPAIPVVKIDASKIKIKGEEIRTGVTSLNLSLAAGAGVKEMYIDGDIINDTNTFEWIPFVDKLTINLIAEDGEKQIAIKYQDAAKNESDVAVKTIVFDTTGPSGNILLEGGAEYTTKNVVSVKIDAVPLNKGGQGVVDAVEIYLSGDIKITEEENTFKWIPYVSPIAVYLTAGDGVKTVKVAFRDDLSNIGGEAEATITLDTTPPKIAAVTSQNLADPEDNSGRYHIGDTIKITIKLEGEEQDLSAVTDTAQAGVKGSLRITSETAGYDSGSQRLTKDDQGNLSFLWETKHFREAENYNVEIKLQDIVGNETVDTSLILSLTSPSVQESVTINNGDDYTKLASVELQIFSGKAIEMLIEGDVKDDSNTFEWILFPLNKGGQGVVVPPPPLQGEGQGEVNVKLTPGDGAKTIKVTFRDKLQRESGPVEDTIILDTEAPQILAVKSPKAFGVGAASERDATDEMSNDNQYHAGETVKLIVEVAKAETGLKGTISIRSSKATYDSGVQRLQDDGAGKYSYLWETKGLKEADDYVVEATVKDLASHQTTDASLAITIDNTPPASGTLVIDTVESRGSIGHLPTETKMRTITLKIAAEDSVQMWIEGDLVDDTNTFEWIPYPSEFGMRNSEFGIELVVNLTPGDGEKVIKVRHQDAAGNEGRVTEATIFLNEYPPVIQSVDSQTFSNNPLTPFGKGESLDKDNPTDADEIYHAGQPIVIIIKAAEAETGLKAMVQIKSEINAYDSGIKIALPTSDFPSFFDQTFSKSLVPTSEGEGSYSYLWDTSGLKSAADYVVKVTLQDTLGQKAVDESLTITIDNEPPTGGKLTINNEDEFTNERRVLLEFRIPNYELRITNYNIRIEGDVVEDAATFKWLPLISFEQQKQEAKVWKEVQLTEGDGKKTVRVQFRDEALNDSLPVEDSITLDTTAPTNTRIVINAGEIETDSRAVTLNVLAEEATEMYIDGDVTESVADETTRNNTFRWIPYESVKQVELTEGDGKKWVGIKYRDDAGNESIRIEASIILDQPGPTLPSVVINGGETYTNSPTASLRLSAEGATEMYVDGDIVPSASTFRWIPYDQYPGVSFEQTKGKATKSDEAVPELAKDQRSERKQEEKVWVELQVNLIKSDGKKRVRARFRNGAGNESEQVESSITLDQTAPVIEVVESYDANNPSDNNGIYHPGQVVLIKTTAKTGETRLDGTIRIKSEEVKYDTGTQKLTDRGDGSYTYIWQTVDLQDAKDYIVKITLEDAVAFTAVDNSLLITLDSTPPLEPNVIIEGEFPHVGEDGGRAISRSRSVKLNLTAEDAVEMFIAGDVINDTNTFQWIPFPLTTPLPPFIKGDKGGQGVVVAAEIVVNVVGNDGEKNIKVKFRDAAMNESEDAEVKVTLELKRPQLLAYVYLIQPDGQKIAYLVLPFDELISDVSQEDFYVNLSNPDKLEEQLQTFANNPLTPQPPTPFGKGDGKGESLDATEVEPEVASPVVVENKVVVQLTEEQVQILSSWQVTGNPTSGPVPTKTGSLPDGIWVQIAENSAFDLVGNGNLGNQRKPSIVRLTRPSFLQQALVEPQEFSPNGDGVKDEAVILYALRNDSNVTVKIENWRQYPIYQWEQITQLKDMTSELKWDGKKQDGSACTDGTYTISIEIIDSLTGVPVVAKTFSVILDNTPPQITSKEPLPGGQIPPTPEIAVEVVDTSENQAASGIDEQNIYVLFDPKAFGVGEASEHNPEQAILLTLPSPSDDGGGKGKYTIPSGRFILNSGQHSVTFHVADKAGNYTEETVEYTVVGTGESPLLKLMNYPNPFKPGGSTTILYVLSDAVKSAVMSIYDAGGNLVLLKQLKGEELESGEHRIEWDGTDIFGEWLARGVYFCEFRIVTKNPGNTAQKRLHKIAVW